MIGMVLVTHGRLAAEFVAALEHVVGAQTQIAAVCIGPDDDMEQRRQDILCSIAAVDTGDRDRHRSGDDRARPGRETHREQHPAVPGLVPVAPVAPAWRSGPRRWAYPSSRA